MNDGPWLHVIAGPNGAGKSTLAETLREQDRFRGTRFVNVDAIAARLSPGAPERAAIPAWDESMRQVRARLAEGKDVAIETNLSGNSKLRLMDEARAHGFRVNLVYVGLENPDRALDRVEGRVAAGGHGIPPSEVVRRYGASLQNLARVLPEVDRAEVYDNSGTRHTRVLTVERGVIRQASDPQPEWLTRTLGSELRPGQRVDPALAPIRADLTRLEQRGVVEKEHTMAIAERHAVERTVWQGEKLKEHTERARETFGRALRRVFRLPDALDIIERQAIQRGAAETLNRLEQRPRKFGELQGWQVGPLASPGRDRALRTLPEAVGAGRDYFALRAAVERGAEALREARAAVPRAAERVERLGADLTRLPGRAELTQRIGERVRDLAPDQARNLMGSLSGAHQAIVNQAVRSLGRGEGNGLDL